MKKLFILLLAIPLALVMMGSDCEDEPADAIIPPGSATLVGSDANHLDLVITWNPSSTSDIDGYRVYFNSATTPLWQGAGNSFTHADPTLGRYEIVAYKGNDESDPLIFNTSDYVYTASGSEIYRFDVAGQPSGYGWNISNGTGASYSFTTANADYIDIWFDNDNTINSGDVYGGAFENITGIYTSPVVYGSIANAPSVNDVPYLNYQDIGSGFSYCLYVRKQLAYGYYGKMEITNWDTSANKITFRWTINTIAKWRVLS
ncbi:MAG TPA: hypothetical protein ENN07_00185 [candidate division Zixibacteria bacterium]|nr:hypothetical protein [candidate division Zixibacteria bacterium]